MNETISEPLWNQLIQEATAVRWVLFRAGAQPTKSDVEDILMERHGLDRHWPHLVMNHLEHNDVLGPSIRQRQWLVEGDEPQLTPDITQHILDKAQKRPLIKRTLRQDILDIMQETSVKIITVYTFTRRVEAILVEDDLWQKIGHSYSGASLFLKSEVNNPFEYQGNQYISTGGSFVPYEDGGHCEVADAYRIVPRGQFKWDVFGKNERTDFDEGFYHRRYAYLNGQMYVLLGPELSFARVSAGVSK